MTPWTVTQAALAGIGVLVAAHVLYAVVLLRPPYHEVLRIGLLSAPGLATLAAAYLSPKWKLFVGLLVGLAGSLIGLLASFVYESFGLHVDRIGGLIATFMILLAYNTALSLMGSGAGIFLSKRSPLA